MEPVQAEYSSDQAASLYDEARLDALPLRKSMAWAQWYNGSRPLALIRESLAK